MYDVAIIGGMGPEATAALFTRLVQRTDAARDQEHLRVCMLSDAGIPDRTEYLLHGGDSPLPRILHNIELARQLGCPRFVIPCNTAHFFADAYRAVEGITFISMVEQACVALKRLHPGQTVCVLGTDGTAAMDIYGRAMRAHGLDMRYPEPPAQQQVMATIRHIKSGAYCAEKLATQLVALLDTQPACDRLVGLLACSELSLLKDALEQLRPGRFVDALDALCESTIEACGHRVKGARA